MRSVKEFHRPGPCGWHRGEPQVRADSHEGYERGCEDLLHRAYGGDALVRTTLLARRRAHVPHQQENDQRTEGMVSRRDAQGGLEAAHSVEKDIFD